MKKINSESILRELFTATVSAADPHQVLEQHLPMNRSRPCLGGWGR